MEVERVNNIPLEIKNSKSHKKSKTKHHHHSKVEEDSMSNNELETETNNQNNTTRKHSSNSNNQNGHKKKKIIKKKRSNHNGSDDSSSGEEETNGAAGKNNSSMSNSTSLTNSSESDSSGSSSPDSSASSSSSDDDVSDLLSLTSESEDEDSSKRSFRPTKIVPKDVEEGEILEGQQLQSYIQSQLAFIKDQIKQCKKKCHTYEKKVKKLSKELKAKKSMGKQPSNKHLKLKKKLESKYFSYKSRLSTLSTKHNMLLNKEANINKKNKLGKKSFNNNNQNSISSPSSNNQQQQQTQVVKLPYPVLNDKRDMSQILTILKEKQRNLNEMFEKTRQTLKKLESGGRDSDDYDETDSKVELEQKQSRIRTVHENIKQQLTRLNRQIDYVKCNLEIAKLNKILEDEDKSKNDEEFSRFKKRLVDLTNQNEDLLTFMKDANRQFIKQQQKEEQKQREKEDGEADDDEEDEVENQDQERQKFSFPKQPQNMNQPRHNPGQQPINYFRNVPPPGMPSKNVIPAASTGTISSKFQPYSHLTPPPSSNSSTASSSSSSSTSLNQPPQMMMMNNNHQHHHKNQRAPPIQQNGFQANNNQHQQRPVVFNQSRVRTPPPPQHNSVPGAKPQLSDVNDKMKISDSKSMSGVRTPPYPPPPQPFNNNTQNGQQTQPPFGRLFATATAGITQQHPKPNSVDSNTNKPNSKNKIPSMPKTQPSTSVKPQMPPPYKGLNNGNNIQNVPILPNSKSMNPQIQQQGGVNMMQMNFRNFMQNPAIMQAITAMFQTMSPQEKQLAMQTGFSNFDFNSVFKMLQSKGLMTQHDIKMLTSGVAAAVNSAQNMPNKNLAQQQSPMNNFTNNKFNNQRPNQGSFNNKFQNGPNEPPLQNPKFNNNSNIAPRSFNNNLNEEALLPNPTGMGDGPGFGPTGGGPNSFQENFFKYFNSFANNMKPNQQNFNIMKNNPDFVQTPMTNAPFNGPGMFPNNNNNNIPNFNPKLNNNNQNFNNTKNNNPPFRFNNSNNSFNNNHQNNNNNNMNQMFNNKNPNLNNLNNNNSNLKRKRN
jgi:hypothetical protein